MNQENKDLLLELYKENQNFLNKLILGVSSLAIPLLYKSALEITEFYIALLLSLSLFFFLVVIALQIRSLVYARNGCDDCLSDNHEVQNRGFRHLDKAKAVDTWRNRLFISALFLIIISLVVNIYNKGCSAMTDKKNTQELRNSFTPPKQMIGFGSCTLPISMMGERSYTPPKVIIDQQTQTNPPPQDINQSQSDK